MKNIDVSIILPTFNEKENIIPLILDINKYVKGTKEIIVADDDSPDGTGIAVSNLIKKQKIKNLKLVTRIRNHGLTNSIWDGIKFSKGKIIVWMDCDFSHPPEVIPKLLLEIDNGQVGMTFTSGEGLTPFGKGLGIQSICIVLLSHD